MAGAVCSDPLRSARQAAGWDALWSKPWPHSSWSMQWRQVRVQHQALQQARATRLVDRAATPSALAARNAMQSKHGRLMHLCLQAC